MLQADSDFLISISGNFHDSKPDALDDKWGEKCPPLRAANLPKFKSDYNIVVSFEQSGEDPIFSSD